MFHVFARYGYEEHEFVSFETGQEAAKHIAEALDDNERNGTGWHLVALIKGDELEVNIEKKETVVKIG